MAKKETNPIGFQITEQSASTITSGATINNIPEPRNFGTIKEIHDWEYDYELDNLYMTVEGFSGELLNIGIKGKTIKELQMILRMETTQQDYYNFKNRNF